MSSNLMSGCQSDSPLPPFLPSFPVLEEFSRLAGGGLSLEDVVEWLETVVDRAVVEVRVCVCACACACVSTCVRVRV